MVIFIIIYIDYNAIRSCCEGSKMCPKCFKFMKAAALILHRALNEDFGFEHILMVFSGRRGIHMWVCDEFARKMPNDVRASVIESLNIVSVNII